MIYLVTGANGASKTSSVIQWVLDESRKRGKLFFNRPVYAFGINEMRVPGWLPIDAEQAAKWYELPKGSVIIIDEAYHVFPTQKTPRDPTPEGVTRLKEHRKDGYDIIFMSQVSDLHKGVRGLVSCHHHLVRRSGSKVVNWFTFDRCVTDLEKPERVPNHQHTRKPLPKKKVFKYYTSTTLDTHKWRPSGKFVAVVSIAVVCCLFLSYKLIGLASSFNDSPLPSLQASVSSDSAPARRHSDTPVRDPFDTESKRNPLDDLPRIDGQPWTAPIYDQVREPKTFPKPKACMTFMEGSRAGECICYSQQATLMYVASDVCLDIVHHGWFDDTVDESAKNNVGRDSANAQHAPRPIVSSSSQYRVIAHDSVCLECTPDAS